jgi:membrane-bound serine protease (ClpP class)
MGLSEIVSTLYQLLTNPNIAFLLLVVGLWSAIFAIFVPGTGLPEAGAVIFLALAAVGFMALPVTLIGLLLIALSVILYMVELKAQTHGALLLSGAVVMGLGALFLINTSDNPSRVGISWPMALGVPAVSALLFSFLIAKGLAAQRAPLLQDLRRLVGQRGVTRTSVAREGTVYVSGEEWSATAEAPIPANTDVVVTERRGLTLKVAAAQPPRAPAVQ